MSKFVCKISINVRAAGTSIICGCAVVSESETSITGSCVKGGSEGIIFVTVVACMVEDDYN